MANNPHPHYPRLARVGDVRITLQRLRETKPPKSPETISEWIKEETKPSPNKPPELINESCVRLRKTTISELVADRRARGVAKTCSKSPCIRSNRISLTGEKVRRSNEISGRRNQMSFRALGDACQGGTLSGLPDAREDDGLVWMMV